MKRQAYRAVLYPCIIIAFLMAIITGFALTAAAEENQDETQAAFVWEFDETTGTLTVSGGDIPDYGYYGYKDAPWYDYRDKITTVIVEDGVSQIGDYSFNGYKSITRVEIGGSVKRIGGTAFGSCSALEALILSEGVETIESHAFYYCQAIKKLTVPASATNVSDSAFYSHKLEEVTFAEGTEVVTCKSTGASASGPFAGSSLKKITFPSTLKTIEGRAFWECRSLEEITIPKSVTSIGYGAFSGNSLATLTFEEDGTEPLVIDESAFSGCELTSLVLPERVTSIGGYAFSGIEAESIHIPKNVTYVSVTAFNSSSSGIDSKVKTITVDENNPTYKSIDGIVYSKDGKTLILCPKGRSGSLTIPEGVTTIASNSFYYCTRLTSVKLPQGLTTIEKNAFAYTTFATITLPKSVTSFDLGAFPSDVNFRQYTPLTAINVEEGNPVYKSENGILYSADGKTLLMCPRAKSGDITVMDGVESIADKGFYGCTKITSISLPDSLKTIGSYAFHECNKLTEIVIPQGVESIGSNAFSGSYSYRFYEFASITLPENLQLSGETFGSYVFGDSSSYATPHVTVTNGTHSIELTGEDAKLVIDNSVEAVPTVKELLVNETITNPVTVTERKGDATYSYTAQPGQLTIDEENNLVLADGYHRFTFDDGNDYLSSVIVEEGTTAPRMADPTKSGFTFIGWYKDEDFTNEWDFENDAVNEDTTIYAKWTFSVSITVDGDCEKIYDGKTVKLTAEYKTGAAYQWYTVENGILTDKTAYYITLNGSVADSATYYCVVTLDGVTSQTDTVAVSISKAAVEFSVEDAVYPKSLVDDTFMFIIASLQSSGITSDMAGEYGVTVNYRRISGGYSNDINSFIQSGLLILTLGDEQTVGELTTYPISICDNLNLSAELEAFYANYDVTFKPSGRLIIKPDAVIAWDDDVVENGGITVEFTGAPVELPDDLFAATDGKTPATELIGGSKGYEFYYEITVENTENGSNSNEELAYFEALLYEFLGMPVGQKEYIYSGDVINPNYIIATGLKNDVESALRDYPEQLGLTSFESLEADFGVKIIFNYYVKAFYSGNDTYYGTESEDYVLLTVTPASLTVSANSQTISQNGEITTDVTAVTLSGNILSNAEINALLTQALPLLLEGGVLEIALDESVDVRDAKIYKNGIRLFFDPSKLEGEDAETVAYFDITVEPGNLTVKAPHTADHCICGKTHISVGDHVDEEVKQYAEISDFEQLAAAAANGGSYYLTNDIELTNVVTVPEGITFNLCFNGNTLYYEGSEKDALFNVLGTFNLTDCTYDGKIAGAKGADVFTTKISAFYNYSSANVTVSYPTYTVMLNYGTNGVDSITVLSEFTAPTAKAIEGKIFVGWYDDADFTVLHDFSIAIDEDITLYAKYADYESDREKINTSIGKLNTALDGLNAAIDEINGVNGSLTTQITELSSAIEIAKNEIASLDDIYATDEELMAAKNELIAAIDEAKITLQSKIDELTEKVAELENALREANDKIDTNADEVTALKNDASLLKGRIIEVENAIAALKELTVAQGADISALMTKVSDLNNTLNTANGKIAAAEERIEALEERVEALEAAKENLDAAVTDLQNAVATKASAEALTEAVNNLNAAIEAAKTYATEKDSELKTAIEGASSVLNNAIDALTARVEALEADIADAKESISQNTDDITALVADLARLNTLLSELNSTLTQDYATKAELESAISNATYTINATLAELVGRVSDIEDANALLNIAVENLQTAISAKADAVTVNAAIAALQRTVALLEEGKDDYVGADATLKAELEEAIAKAKQEAIDTSKSYAPYIGDNGNWWIGDTDTGVDASGIKGDTGAAGSDGVGIIGIEKTSTDGSVDTYTITLTSGVSYTFTVTNGTKGEDGKDGKDGEDGKTPEFKVENGKLYVRYSDTEEWTLLGNVQGEKGDKGDAGQDGKDGEDGEVARAPKLMLENGNLYIRYSDTEEWTLLGNVQGEKGDKGDAGRDGEDGEDGEDGKSETNTQVILSIILSGFASITSLIIIGIIRKNSLLL